MRYSLALVYHAEHPCLTVTFFVRLDPVNLLLEVLAN